MLDFFLDAYRDVPVYRIVLEAIAFFFGIASVWYAKQENILVYPVGLISTAISSYLYLVVDYYGDAIVNVYYTALSLYGWYNWSKQKKEGEFEVTRTNLREKLTGVALFFLTIVVIFAVYKVSGHPMEVDNYIDILVSGIFFTAMWYMALKKIENWTLWIIGDLIAIPLCAYRGLGMFSLQYIIFTILAIMAYVAWRKTLSNSQ